jgi:hypothetical protein
MLIIILFIIFVFVYYFSLEDFDIMNPYYNKVLPLSYIETIYPQVDVSYILGTVPDDNYIKNDNSIDIFKNRILLKDNFGRDIKKESKQQTCTLVSIINNDGEYNYKYQKYYNENCDINKFELNDNNQLFLSDISGNIGSCRHFFYECSNFITLEECKKFNTSSRKFLTWSPKTCYDKIIFTPLDISIHTTDEFSSKIPVTYLNNTT